eukprot:CAMPEP_0119354038 /NCGR_PEP_ID=MMETSP1334-20130426/3129_1 /TAXON_ID=127549 /ORGANISM="Calcidiscus leptoporus, Strain RCC1130" /LENGTH=752 /DNA_ID=CAMNT_0007367495 /DNA_START=14 /DNA_END=2272 /DNA_ORIENTATION=+
MASFLPIIAGVVSQTGGFSGPSWPPTAVCPNLVATEYGAVCECDGTCGNVWPDPTPSSPRTAIVVTTSEATGFMETEEIGLEYGAFVRQDTTVPYMDLTASPAQTHQEIKGFGASITDAVAYCLRELLSPAAAEELLKQAFQHAGFSFARVHLGSTDFSRMNYALAHERDLSDWCLRDDRTADGEVLKCAAEYGEEADYKVGVLKEALARNPELKVIVSAWSAPPEYKHQQYSCAFESKAVLACEPDLSLPPVMNCTTHVADPADCVGREQQEPCPTDPPTQWEQCDPRVCYGCDVEEPDACFYPNINSLKFDEQTPPRNAAGNCYNGGFIRDEAYDAWASHYARFIADYATLGVPVWGVTAQNEPGTQTGLWQSNFFTDEGQVEWVKDHLAPALRAAHPQVKIMLHDDQPTTLLSKALPIAQQVGRDAVDGIAFHWYTGVEAVYVNGPAKPPVPGTPIVNGGEDVKKVYEDPSWGKPGEKFMLMSESCSGYSLGTTWVGPRHGAHDYGYSTAHDMLWHLRNRAAGYVYWNLLLDHKGGPNVAGNFVDSPAFVIDENKFGLNPSFFYMSHFSRFVPPGSTAIEMQVQCGAKQDAYCQYVSFRTPTGQVVVVITNDDIRAGPAAVVTAGLPALARGQCTSGRDCEPIEWTVRCQADGAYAKGRIAWRAIQTVVMPCAPPTPPSSPPSEAPSAPAPSQPATSPPASPLSPPRGDSKIPCMVTEDCPEGEECLQQARRRVLFSSRRMQGVCVIGV